MNGVAACQQLHARRGNRTSFVHGARTSRHLAAGSGVLNVEVGMTLADCLKHNLTIQELDLSGEAWLWHAPTNVLPCK
eukprot:4333142-Pleurochrysis_carterae.AAC.7